MDSILARVAQIPKLSRFGWLMALYAENHAHLTRLFAPQDLRTGRYVSSIGDGMDVYLDVIETHPYTVELRMTYGVIDAQTGEPDPSAFVRVYRDAKQAEATHCYVGKRWQDTLGMFPPPARLIGHRVRMNTFLGKWLEYLACKGHGVATLKPLADAASTA